MQNAKMLAEKMKEKKIVAIARGIKAEDILPLADALRKGGVCMLEVTFDHGDALQERGQNAGTKATSITVSGSMETDVGKTNSGAASPPPEAFYGETLRAISLLSKERGDTFYVGAGTVLSAKQVRLAKEAGARYIVTPNVNPEVIAEAVRLDMATLIGAYTPTEVEYAYRLGADIVKVFPAGCAGPAYIKALRGPLSHIPLAAVGGVSSENIASFLQAGCVCAGVGGKLADRKKIAAGDFASVTEEARRLTRVCAEFLESNRQ